MRIIKCIASLLITRDIYGSSSNGCLFLLALLAFLRASENFNTRGLIRSVIRVNLFARNQFAHVFADEVRFRGVFDALEKYISLRYVGTNLKAARTIDGRAKPV